MRWLTARRIKRSFRYPLVERYQYIRERKSADMALYLRAKSVAKDHLFSDCRRYLEEASYHRRLHFKRLQRKTND